jgi:multidrug efflux pump subunit AcrA (membrane-fusion protein)
MREHWREVIKFCDEPLKRIKEPVPAKAWRSPAIDRRERNLRQNRNYASVVAPFDGVITQRNVDVGTLVQGNATSGTFMFEIMQEDVIRVRVYVPQDAAFGVTSGIDAIVRVPEIPDREFPGKVARIADALQAGTRTLLTEIDIPNPDGALPPGIYCAVELQIPRKSPSVSVPADAMIFDRPWARPYRGRRNSSGGLAMLAAIPPASSPVSRWGGRAVHHGEICPESGT